MTREGGASRAPRRRAGKHCEPEQAWERIIAAQPRYAKYQRKTDRQLPVIHLAPRPS